MTPVEVVAVETMVVAVDVARKIGGKQTETSERSKEDILLGLLLKKLGVQQQLGILQGEFQLGVHIKFRIFNGKK